MQQLYKILLLFFLTSSIFAQNQNNHFQHHKKGSSEQQNLDLEPGSPAAMAAEVKTLGIQRFAQKYWDQVLFLEDSSELTIEGEGILHLIGKAFREDTWYYKLQLRVAQGSTALVEERRITIEELMYKAGLRKKDFKLKQVMVSDMQKYWDAKNDSLWIRLD